MPVNVQKENLAKFTSGISKERLIHHMKGSDFFALSPGYVQTTQNYLYFI